ncbi:hypothetical protein A9179_01305 [Pseudomonas alcaligenes]|uniref:Bacterial type II secretion system protein E domain-containing protein n=1 Tax=Aquipseudomonas alcaligenes TaxID=43263 RepID=A0ABR7RUR2_AQUAC|nr:GspE/PulE family protein [Pseudomonas alcaligenes]MBC9248901.1 hypothetical protein [Pseudomonas alcaligenes]
MSAIANPGFVVRMLELGLVERDEVRRLMGGEEDALPLVRHMLAVNRLPQQECLMAWAEGFGHTWIDLGATLVDPSALSRLPRDIAESQCVMPVYQLGDKVTVVIANPDDRALVARVEAIIKTPISLVVALPEVIAEAVQLNYPSATDIADLESSALQTDKLRKAEEDINAAAKSAEIIRLTEALITLAIRERASDIHISPRETDAAVRFRVDGIMATRFVLAHTVQQRVAARIKVLAKMDIAERRLPQDGRLSIDLPTRRVEFRVSSVPSLFGENLVLRIIATSSGRDIPKLRDLDFGADNLRTLETMLARRAGLILVVGPTGAGKTTTLFSALNSLDATQQNILTVEEPVEYVLPGATQVAVNRGVGLGFVEVLRAFVRQDPDVILIGEIRDHETLTIGFEAALTGHLVLASIHGNNTMQSIIRLRQLGAQDEWLATALLGVVAQRIVRRICPACRTPYTPSQEELSRYFEFKGNPEVSFYRGTGCEKCQHTGYKGRIAIHEVVELLPELQDLVISGARPSEISATASRLGLRSLRYDGLKKVLRGMTTIDELDKEIPA